MHSTRHIRRTYYLIISVFWLATALPMALIILLAQARGLDLFQVGLLMGIYSLTIVLLEVPTGGLADAIGRKRVAVIAYSCITVAGVVILFAFSFPVILAGFILTGIGRALSSGALDAWFVDALQAADPEVDLQPALAKAGTFTFLSLGLGTLLGSFIPRLFSGLPADGSAFASLAGYVGAMIGGAGLGYVAEHMSISMAWIMAGIVLVVSLALYWRVDVRQSQGRSRLKSLSAEA